MLRDALIFCRLYSAAQFNQALPYQGIILIHRSLQLTYGESMDIYGLSMDNLQATASAADLSKTR